MIQSIVTEYAKPSDKAIGLLFSASYCKWCKVLCPLLQIAYDQLKTHNIQILLVGSDKTEESYAEYAAEHVWPYMNFSDYRRKNSERIFISRQFRR